MALVGSLKPGSLATASSVFTKNDVAKTISYCRGLAFFKLFWML